ncbi:MAG: type II secretion system F family protein [Acidobacteriota bacterium]|nr:type II secretion system F family protein [Acidobacteriota bacterium]
MTPVFYLAVGMTIFSAFALAIAILFTRTSRATIRRMREVTHGGRSYRRSAPAAVDAGRKLFTFVHWLRAHLGLADSADLPERLANAGYRGSLPADLYNSARILGPLLAAVGANLIPSARLFCTIALPAVAFIAPNIVLTRLIKRRREKIRRSIPDAIDLLVICVDAGLGIDQALLRVGQELGISHPQITEELLQINREQRAGKPRIQAWADMAKRSQLPDIDAFSSMLLQTERFGTPIARALSVFADTIRTKRRQLAEQMAAKTTVKIIFPLVLFIFPSIFIVLLGPAVLTIMRGMSSVGP